MGQGRMSFSAARYPDFRTSCEFRGWNQRKQNISLLFLESLVPHAV